MRKKTFLFLIVILTLACSAACGRRAVTGQPQADEFIPDPPVTAADTSVQFVVGAPVVDKQVFDKTDSKVIDAFNAYHSATNDNMPLIFFSDYYTTNLLLYK